MQEQIMATTSSLQAACAVLELSGNIVNSWGKLTPTFNYRLALTASLSVHQPASPPSQPTSANLDFPYSDKSSDKTTCSSDPSQQTILGYSQTFLRQHNVLFEQDTNLIVVHTFQFSLHVLLLLATATILNFIFCPCSLNVFLNKNVIIIYFLTCTHLHLLSSFFLCSF